MINKILLINPPAMESFTRMRVTNYPPLNLLSLAAYQESKGYTVKILDASLLNLTPDQTLNKIMSIKPDLVGFTFMTSQFEFVKQSAKLIKEENQDIIIVGGGVHASVLPKKTLEEIPFFDYLIFHEGEITFEELLKFLNKSQNLSTDKLKTIKGIAFRSFEDKNKIIQNENRELIADVNSLPFPAWHLIDIEKYRIMSSHDRGKKSKGVSVCISTGRGCPFQCVFCAAGSVFGQSYRAFNANGAFRQLEYLYKRGVKDFLFFDEILTLDKEKLQELCNKIINDKLKISWSCGSRVDIPSLTPNTLELMKKAGCVRIDFGVESGNFEILKRIKKRITIEQVIKTYKMVKDAGIQTTTFMMVGHPYENINDVNDSLELIAKIETEFSPFTNATPFPGTELFQIANKNNWIATPDWNEYWILNPLGIMGNGIFTNKEILKLTLYANAICYLFNRTNQLKGKMNLMAMMGLFFKDIITPNRFGYIPLLKKYNLLKSLMKMKNNPKEFSKLLHSYSLNDLHYPYFLTDPEKLLRIFMPYMKNRFRLPSKQHNKWKFDDFLTLFKVGIGALMKIPTLLVYFLMVPFMSRRLLKQYKQYYIVN